MASIWLWVVHVVSNFSFHKTLKLPTSKLVNVTEVCSDNIY